VDDFCRKLFVVCGAVTADGGRRLEEDLCNFGQNT
jgi:hypothetical protein